MESEMRVAAAMGTMDSTLLSTSNFSPFYGTSTLRSTHGKHAGMSLLGSLGFTSPERLNNTLSPNNSLGEDDEY